MDEAGDEESGGKCMEYDFVTMNARGENRSEE